MKYRIALVNIDGAIIWERTFIEPVWPELDGIDVYTPLLGDHNIVDCILNSPYQEDKRALYRLRIERL